MSPISLLRTALTGQMLLPHGGFLDPYDGIALRGRLWPHAALSLGIAPDVAGLAGPARSCDVHPPSSSAADEQPAAIHEEHDEIHRLDRPHVVTAARWGRPVRAAGGVDMSARTPWTGDLTARGAAPRDDVAAVGVRRQRIRVPWR